MSKKEDTKLLKIQTYVLKVHIHCDGCNKNVKKLLRKIDGVYTTSIDAEQGKVTVSGTVDAAILIKKLAKAGKHAELLLPKGNSVNNTKPQQKENGKPQKGGGGGGPAAKDPKGQLQQQQLELLQQLKGFKDLKLPQLKDQKNVKFALPLEDGSDFDDELDRDYDDEDDEGFDDIDGFEDDFDTDPKQAKQQDFGVLLKGGSAAAGGKKGGGGGGVEIPVHFTGGGKKGGKGGDGGGGDKDAKNGGKNNKGGGNSGNPSKVMGQPGMGGMQGAAVKGLPAAAPTGMLPPAAAANAYQQQQYMAAMMQQRAMMNGEYGGYPQMGYMRVAPAPPPGEPIGNYYYSDENASWCSIM